jgi:hypothetical protein
MIATMARRTVLIAWLWLAAIGFIAGGARLPATAERAISAVTAAELRLHVEALASDDMAGRGVGQPGNQRAETYIANALASARVRPAAGDSFLQQFELYEPELRDDGHLVLASKAVRAELRTGSHFYPLPISNAKTVTAPLVFAGHGLTIPSRRHDDYAHLKAQGAIVLVLDGLPSRLADDRSLASHERTNLESIERKAADAVAHGAAGLLVMRPHLMDSGAVWPARDPNQSPEYLLLPLDAAARIPMAAISELGVPRLRAALAAGESITATLTPGVAVRPFVVHNVVASVEGREADGRETVIVGAHMDHDGVDASGRIYNGADDNASGTAAVMALAAAFTRAAAEGQRPLRRVVFALWNGEERGSLGAEAYASTVRADRRIIANINLDMVGRAEDVDPANPRFHGFTRRSPGESPNLLHVLGYSHSPDLAAVLSEANETIGLDLREEYDRGAQNLLERSDHWVFLKRGIPAVFLTTGMHPDYHTPTDDADRLDYAKLERVTELAGRAAWLTAEGAPPRLRK